MTRHQAQANANAQEPALLDRSGRSRWSQHSDVHGEVRVRTNLEHVLHGFFAARLQKVQAWWRRESGVSLGDPVDGSRWRKGEDGTVVAGRASSWCRAEVGPM